MQHKLFEEKPKNELNLKYVCFNSNCRLDIQETKYPAVWKNGAWRPLLENVFNLWICPKCGMQYFDKNFFKWPKKTEKKRCIHCGGKGFRWDYRKRELYCVLCGLVDNEDE